MPRDIFHDGPGYQDKGFQTGSHIPNITRFIPLVIAPQTAERSRAERYSLFAPIGDDDFQTQQDLTGKVVELGYGRRIDVSTTHKSSDTRQIPVGIFSTTIEIPNDLGGLAYQALIPSGIDALRRGNSVFGATWRNNGHQNLNVFESPIPDLLQKRKDELSARYYAGRSSIEAGEQLVGDMVRQDFVNREPTIEMNKVFHTVDGTDPSVEDAYHRFGSFDMRLLFPSLQEVNASSLTFDQLQALYPERIVALRDGYLTLDRLSLESVPQQLVTDPEMLVHVKGSSDAFVPSLMSLYRIYELRQAGFDIKLAEAEVPAGFGDTDRPTQREFVAMVKPPRTWGSKNS